MTRVKNYIIRLKHNQHKDIHKEQQKRNMKENNTTQKSNEEVKKLASSYLELFKVKSAKKSAQVATGASYVLLTVILIIMSFTFFGFALAFFIGELLGLIALGFVIVGAIPLVTLLLMRLFNRNITDYLLNFFTRLMTKNDE